MNTHKDKGVKKECNHKWQIVYQPDFIYYKQGQFGESKITGHFVAVCMKCFEIKYHD